MHLKPAGKPLQKPSRKSSHTLALLPRAALPRYLTQDEVTRFFAVISSPRDRALFALIYTACGSRKPRCLPWKVWT